MTKSTTDSKHYEHHKWYLYIALNLMLTPLCIICFCSAGVLRNALIWLCVLRTKIEAILWQIMQFRNTLATWKFIIGFLKRYWNKTDKIWYFNYMSADFIYIYILSRQIDESQTYTMLACNTGSNNVHTRHSFPNHWSCQHMHNLFSFYV